MIKNKHVLVLGILLAASTSFAVANDDEQARLEQLQKQGWFDITTSAVTKVSETDMKVEPKSYMAYSNDCTSLVETTQNGQPRVISVAPTPPAPTTPPEEKPKPTTPPPTTTTPPLPTLPKLPGVGGTGGIFGDVTLDQIINLGQKIWTFIQSNAPTVNAKTMTANALPRGIKCWDELDNWQPPRSEVYEASYKNAFGYEVVNMQVRLVYSYGGQVNGVGRYLTNATLQYKNLKVAWGGFKVDAEVEIPMVTNLGSKASPVAGMQVNLHWKVNNLNSVQKTAGFFIFGDGRPSMNLQ